MEFQLSYFKSWKMMLWKCCTQYASKFGKLSSGHRTGKRSVFIPIPKKGNAKECSNYHIIALISHASKVMLKILQARLQQYVNCELPDVQAGFRKGKGTRDHIANIRWNMEKAREFQRKIYFCFTDYAKAFVWITRNWGKVMTNLDSIEKQRHYFANKGSFRQSYGPVVMYGCESWTVKKAEHQRIDALNCGVGEDSCKSLGLQGDSTSPS